MDDAKKKKKQPNVTVTSLPADDGRMNDLKISQASHFEPSGCDAGRWESQLSRSGGAKRRKLKEQQVLKRCTLQEQVLFSPKPRARVNEKETAGETRVRRS
jgi:hypothetical protein